MAILNTTTCILSWEFSAKRVRVRRFDQLLRLQQTRGYYSSSCIMELLFFASEKLFT